MTEMSEELKRVCEERAFSCFLDMKGDLGHGIATGGMNAALRMFFRSGFQACHAEMQKDIAAKDELIKTLVGALEFYAPKEYWEQIICGDNVFDCQDGDMIDGFLNPNNNGTDHGRTARAALSKAQRARGENNER